MTLLSLFDRLDDSQDGKGSASACLSVTELTARIKGVLETDFADVQVAGEISNLAKPRSGHVYFSLKDANAQIRAVIWKSTAQGLPFDLTDGLAVKARGEIGVYAPRGEYQIIIRKIEPEGIGALELAFRQRFEKLRAEGLFDPDRKRPLPKYPRKIAVVTSPTGAAVRDFLQVTGRRWSATEILIVPAKVQGLGSAEEVAAAIDLANRTNGVDLIVVARGGGSVEDLWTFNEELVVRAIASSRLPVISAVGHEVDVTLADFAADFRALTPSEAGERCVPDAREARIVLDRLRDRLARGLRDRLVDARFRLDDLAARAQRAVGRYLDDRRNRLARLAAQLDALSPLRVLARGYSVTLHPDGRTPLQSAQDVHPGDRITTRLQHGQVVSIVEQIRD